MILPVAVYAGTVRCTTELKRMCDSAQVCTKTANIHPAIEYVIDLPDEPRTARIAKMVGGRRVASWKAELVSDGDSSRHEYSMPKDATNTFSLSKSFTTFSCKFTSVIGKTSWEQNEVGICSAGAP
jgi:hypothetical protein